MGCKMIYNLCRTHPDRLVNASPAQKKLATERFQAVADAYYMLSDATRRREYDSLRASKTSSERSTDSKSSYNFFSQFFGGSSAGTPAEANQQPDAEGVFTDVFEEVRTTIKDSDSDSKTFNFM